MRINKYVQYIKYTEDVYIYYNSYNNKFLLLNKDKHKLFEQLSDSKFENNNTDLYNVLKDNLFIVEDDFHEYENIVFLKNKNTIQLCII